MGMTSKETDHLLYLKMRAEGESHEDCVEFFHRCGTDIDHILSLSAAQMHFGERWARNTVVFVVLCIGFMMVIWLLN